MTTLPSSVPVLVVGAGVHGLSTAWHLAQKGERVLVVDKTSIAGALRGARARVRNTIPPHDRTMRLRLSGNRSGGLPLPGSANRDRSGRRRLAASRAPERTLPVD